MTNYTKRLTRRSFSTWLTASGFALSTSGRVVAQDWTEPNHSHQLTGNWREVYDDQDGSSVQVVCRDIHFDNGASHTAIDRSEPLLGTDSYGQASVERRSRDGRPPSEWLRSLDAEELHAWLASIEVPEARVHGMSFWTHLTRDHMFQPLLIKGLTEIEQAKLHAAAHFGY